MPAIARAATSLAAGAVLLGCLLPPPAGLWLLAAGAALLPSGLMALAAERRRVMRRARLVFLVLTIFLGGTLAALIRWHVAGAAGSAALLLQLLGLWFLPLLLTGLGYAATFAPRTDRRSAEPADSEDAP